MILDKISMPKRPLNRRDLTPNQKKHLYDVMGRYGATPGFTYDRFFKEGFDEWELMGIDAAKLKFMESQETKENIRENGKYSEGSGFYELLGELGLKMAFVAHMRSLGMGCSTVLERFGKQRESGFREFERIGVLHIVAIFEAEVSALGIN